jgi:hypothetical protein
VASESSGAPSFEKEKRKINKAQREKSLVIFA